MKNLGRTPYKEIKLLNGFYIEVRNKGSKDRGIKIRSADKDSMKEAAKSYSRDKDVVILGEYKDEGWV